MLTSALDGVTSNLQNTSVQQTLGDIKASIPYNEAQVQLALAGTQAALSNQINTNLVTATQGFADVNLGIANATATIIATENSVKDTVQAGNAANALAVAGVNTQGIQNTFALSQVITNDGEKTRALITSQFESNLQRQLTVAESRGLEDRVNARIGNTTVDVTQTVNQVQAQAQAQQQQQQQLMLLAQIASGLGNLTQIAHATNSNIIAGNTGATTTGAQTASPTNVNTA
jgi:hypothetical protein